MLVYVQLLLNWGNVLEEELLPEFHLFHLLLLFNLVLDHLLWLGWLLLLFQMLLLDQWLVLVLLKGRPLFQTLFFFGQTLFWLELHVLLGTPFQWFGLEFQDFLDWLGLAHRLALPIHRSSLSSLSSRCLQGFAADAVRHVSLLLGRSLVTAGTNDCRPNLSSLSWLSSQLTLPPLKNSWLSSSAAESVASSSSPVRRVCKIEYF